MVNKYRNKLMACLCLLVLVLSLTGCKGDSEKDKTEETQGTTVDGNSTNPVTNPVTNQGSNGGVGNEIDTKNYPEDSVTFTTNYSYKNMLNLHLPLAEGLQASDITEISFTLDTDMPLELRLYGGSSEAQKSSSSELTGSTVEAVATLSGSEKVEIEGTSIDQENYSLSLENKDSTRFYLVEGEGQKLVFNVDSRASKVLSNVQGGTLVLGMYANNTAPEFTIYSVSFTAKGTVYEVVLDESTAKPSKESFLMFH